MPPTKPTPFTLATITAIKHLTPKIESNPDPLQSIRDSTSLYGLYMQATIGDYRRPFPTNPDIYERTAWLKWMSHKGMSQAEAQKQYVEMVSRLMAEYGVED
ncbi:hypothetical protein TWF730_008609 [Orbilia blumenaviensis]|uniref:ACB domain-containing protein n=1 Tax=Orbilia blumenaviensis TaxID=1796055 RepID=A0AAV9V5H2_9PEZI